MFVKQITVLFTLVLAGRVYTTEQDVLDLTDADFTTRLAETGTTVVMFYAPWCGHCKRLKPEYAKAAESLLADDPPVTLAKIDCTEDGKETCAKLQISGYPSLKIYQNGEYSKDYSGPREADGIVKYMRAQVGPSSKDLKGLNAFEDFLKIGETAVVGFFKKESDLKGVFLKYADQMREKLRFGHTSDPEILKKQGEDDAIIVFRAPQLSNKFEPNFVKFNGLSKDDLTTFVKENLYGLVGHRTRDSITDFKNPLIVGYYAVDYIKNVKGTNYWRNRILKVAKEFEGKINFAISDKGDFQHELNDYGYDYTGDKPVMLAKDHVGRKFIMKGEFSVENLQTFANDIEEGNIDPYIKSEPIPEPNDGPVVIAVGKNFEDVVTNNNKDSLIEFYAPWCGHCKKLTPIYEELGTTLKNEEIAIIKMDATANDVPPNFDVKGFPTLYWVPKNNPDKPVRYEGGRDIDDFIKYIAKHSTNELKGFDRSGQPKKKTEL